MPRSIQQLKHRVIQFETISAQDLTSAIRALEMLPGITALADAVHCRIVVDYWVDEYMLSQIEFELVSRGYPLENGIRNRIMRAEIQRDEEAERDSIDMPLPRCYSGGVFAKTYDPGQAELQALPN